MGAPINIALTSPKEELSIEEDDGKFDIWDVERDQLHWDVKELDESQFEVTSKEEKYVDFWEVKGDFSLNLSLNYQEVMDAWSNRGSLWTPANVDVRTQSVGEVTMVVEEERERRRASVLKYKEKRQSRLFSKKIRYEVRKLNAENRPRFKGRFVKRGPDS